jgi:hypothetical protein
MVPTKAYPSAYPRRAATAPDSPTSRTSSSSGTSNSPRPTTPPAWAMVTSTGSPGSSSYSTYDGDYSVATTDSPNSQATSVKSAPETRRALIADARERGARMRSHSMLEDLIMSDVHLKDIGSNHLRPSTTTARPLTVRQAAAKRGEIKELQKDLVRVQLKDGKALLAKSAAGRRRPVSYQPMPQAQKKLAETTRPPRALTADDLRDPETISGMKCQMDWDRQKWAEKRALSLLESGAYF